MRVSATCSVAYHGRKTEFGDLDIAAPEVYELSGKAPSESSTPPERQDARRMTRMTLAGCPEVAKKADGASQPRRGQLKVPYY